MASRWGVSPNARQRGLGAFQGIVVWLVPALAAWVLVALVVWVVI